jgi:hypothetical protein
MLKTKREVKTKSKIMTFRITEAEFRLIRKERVDLSSMCQELVKNIVSEIKKPSFKKV